MSWSVVIMLIVSISGGALGIAEVGVGVMAPDGAGSALGKLVLVPHVAFDLALLAVGVDLWISPGVDSFVLLPFLQLQIPLPWLKLYGSLGPIFVGGAEGISLIPPALGMFAKLGATITPFGFLGVYGEMILGISPLMMTISSTSYVIGVRLGF
jgi:hypothetical protein